MRRLPLFTSSAHPASPFTSYGSTASPTHNSCTPYTPGKLPLAASRLPGFPASRFRPAPAVSPTSAASPPCCVAALPRCRLAALPPCRVGASPPWRVGATPWSLASAAPWPSGRRAAGARGAQMSGVAGGAWARVPGKTRPRKVVSRFGHSRAHMALNRHFSDHFVRFVHRFSAISERRLSPRENRLVCAARRWLTCTGPPRRCRAKRADAQALALTPHQALSRARWRRPATLVGPLARDHHEMWLRSQQIPDMPGIWVHKRLVVNYQARTSRVLAPPRSQLGRADRV